MPKEDFKESMLSKTQLEDFNFVKKRIFELQEARKEEQYGVMVEDIWAAADRDYAPHRLKSKTKRSDYDEDKGWRGQSFTAGVSDWKSDVSQANPFIKIGIAQSILIDQNPAGVFTATSKKYQATSTLMKQLYDRSWDLAKSRQQLKLFVHNLSKYGIAYGRTYPLRITRNVKSVIEFNSEDPDKTEYEDREVVEYNDIFRENLDPWNVWLDDMTRPNNHRSTRDWSWRKVYSMDAAEEEFGKWKNWKYVQVGGIVTDKLDEKNRSGKKYKETQLVEVYFYENILKDLFAVIANGVPIVLSPLPISDAQGNKKLSLWWAYWLLRHAECQYGVGIYEAIRYDQGFLDRIRNMTVDQLTLSIYKMFFYQGTNQLTETGDIVIAPGVGKQTLDPKNINFLEIPGPGRDAWEGIQMFKKDLDEASGITDPLLGNITGKTAFEIAQAKEAALKRLKTPLENITDALDQEAYVTIALVQLLYSIPETYKVADPQLIEDYLKEIQGDPDLYERDEEGSFVARVFPEFPLNLDEDEKGNLVETEETRFFRVKPKFLKWEGIINVKSQSILTPSKQIDKALELEMWNMLIPLLGNPLGPQTYVKAAKSIVKLYDKDPRDVLPDSWLQEPEQLQAQAQANEPLIIPANEAPQSSAQSLRAPQAETQIPSVGLPQRPQSIAGRVSAGLGRLFR